MTALRRALVALLLTGLLAAWVAPASAEEIAPPPGSGAPAPDGEGPTAPDAEDPVDPADPGPVEPAEPGEPDPVDPVDPVEPGEPGTGEPDGTVTGAVLRWGLNHESNNRAFAPHTFNFFRAGRLPDPGRGGVVMTSAQWTGVDGNVSIEKWDGSSYRPADWSGLSTDETGTTIPSPTSGKFSGHQVVFANGSGTVDPHAGAMSLTWDGDVTVVYYSGMSFFYLSDPTLDITGGSGTLTAELSGFASSQLDPTQWGSVAPRRVTVATFSDATISADGVLQATPDYAGVLNGLPEQVRTGADAGSFPTDFIEFQQEAGAASYWFSSGGSTDRFKAALPVTVLVDPAMLPPAPVVPVVSNPVAPVNSILTPPPRSTPRAAAPRVAPVATVPAPPPAPAAYQSAGDHGWVLGQVPVSDQLVWWLLAAALLTMAASTVTASAVYAHRLRPRA
ncbi:HtaA domain-containing protein [Aeromicrobium sp.]|uniref:HtaA domain-containing protein n=1 Tax=Aeromicrobium sp. TaxID=1871063 RepID=UPI0025C0F253|nr:HtaA domain-containing protein [Aeromicrobium sp.]MCK5891913.1 HtaA domain-containing protein [Aeromicrobium sp.]